MPISGPAASGPRAAASCHLNLRPPVSCSDRSCFGTEYLFRPGLFVILHAGKVINPITAPAAVPLDIACRRWVVLRSPRWRDWGGPSTRFSRRYSVLLRQGELRFPDPCLCRTCAMLMCEIVVAVGPKRRGPPILHHGGIDVRSVRRACSEKPIILVYLLSLAIHRLACDYAI
mgnify:FL=1